MKTFAKWLFVLAFPLAIYSKGMAAEYPTAVISTEYCVSIDTEQPVSEFYEIDIEHLHLNTEEAAQKRFGFISNNLLTYSVDFEAKKVYLHLHLDRTSETKDVLWWNEYINSLCES